MCSIFHCFETNPKKPHDLVEETISFRLCIDTKNFTIRLVHPGGKEEFFRYAIPVLHVMQKYPGMCIATPEVFRRPHASVLSAGDELSPGHKYYLISKTTVKKLKLKWLNRKKEKRLRRINEEMNSKFAEIWDTSGDIFMNSFGSAKEFYGRSHYEKESGMKKKKPLVPPIHKHRTRKVYEWEPGLASIEESSP